MRATRLLVADGAVTGVEAEEGTRYEGAVVLASGGFERDEELLRTFMRGPLLAPAGPPTKRGDGLRMGTALGARLANMSEAWWAPSMHVPGEKLDGAPFYRILFTDCAQPGSLLVDGRGGRFTNESANYSDLGRSFQAFDASTYSFPGARAWLIFDAARRAGRGLAGDSVWSLDPGQPVEGAVPVAPPEEDPDWLVRAVSLEELARRIEVDAAACGRPSSASTGRPPAGATRASRAASPRTTASAWRARRCPRWATRRTTRCASFRSAGHARRPQHRRRRARATIGPAMVFGWKAGEHAAARAVRLARLLRRGMLRARPRALRRAMLPAQLRLPRRRMLRAPQRLPAPACPM